MIETTFHKIGHLHRPYIIAEIGMAHEGSVAIARSMIMLASTCGASAVKFQAHYADEESSYQEEFRVPNPQYKTRFDYWKGTSFTIEQWINLKEFAHSLRLDFGVSPFSEYAARMQGYHVKPDFFKVASGEVKYFPYEVAPEYSIPIILSTGMSTIAEIDEAVEKIDVPFVVLQCTSQYPASTLEVGLNVIEMFRERYGIAGLSDHTGRLVAPLAAIMHAKASVIEVHLSVPHLTLADSSSSLSPQELQQLTSIAQSYHLMKQETVDKDEVAARSDIQRMKSLFEKSVLPVGPIPKGTTLTRDHLRWAKPGTGIRSMEEVIGRKTKHDIHNRYNMILPDDLCE